MGFISFSALSLESQSHVYHILVFDKNVLAENKWESKCMMYNWLYALSNLIGGFWRFLLFLI